MSTDLNGETAATLRAVAHGAGLSISEVAANAGLPALYVDRRLSGVATLSVEDLVALCEAMNAYPPDVLALVLRVGAVPARPPAVVAGT